LPYEYVIIERDGEVGILTINRPKALNALNREVLVDLRKAIEELRDDDTVKVIIITGAGEKSFVAGADIGTMQPFGVQEARDWARLGQSVLTEIENLEKPVIAAVNGFALGGGCELALACDIRIASDQAKLGQPEVGLGILPGYGGTQRLPRLVGKGTAKRLIFTGEMIGAEEAREIGLVDMVVGADELMEAALKMARTIASKGQVAVRLAKIAINRGCDMDLASGIAYEAEVFAECFATEDQKEGMKAFLEKRKPRFTGK